jgi:hypothetical protein
MTASSAASCLARTFLALDLLQTRAVFILYLIFCLELELPEKKRVRPLPVRSQVEPLPRVPRPRRLSIAAAVDRKAPPAKAAISS